MVEKTVPQKAAPLIPVLAFVVVIGAGCASLDPRDSNAPGSSAESSNQLPQGSEPVTLDPADFVATIDHPYWPMTPGNVWIYSEINGGGNQLRVEVTVTDDTKEILGITATVVHDVVTLDGELIEEALAWYAQDTTGNLWYLGEDAKEYEDGEAVGAGGSWEAGVDGAQPGILLPADPQVGMSYRHVYYAGEAEDEAEVLSVDESAEVPAGSFDGCLQTEDFTPLDPDVVEHKFYAEGVGPVLVVQVSGGESRAELTSYIHRS